MDGWMGRWMVGVCSSYNCRGTCTPLLKRGIGEEGNVAPVALTNQGQRSIQGPFFSPFWEAFQGHKEDAKGQSGAATLPLQKGHQGPRDDP